MYFHSKFQDKQTKDAKVMSKKPHVGGQGGQKKGQVFPAITYKYMSSLHNTHMFCKNCEV